jgi:adenylylsulfate kinase
MAFKENAKRSLVKSVTFRVLVITSDFIIITLITHSYDLAVTVIILSNLASATLYYLHERAWNKIKWGKQ